MRHIYVDLKRYSVHTHLLQYLYKIELDLVWRNVTCVIEIDATSISASPFSRVNDLSDILSR